MTHYSTPTITINIHSPLILGGAYIRSLDSEVSSYSHTISVVGGFLSASMAINSSISESEDWIANGLGRHIVAYGLGGEVVWEGFVDNISVNMGNITIDRGRLTEICNRCSTIYTPIIDYDPEGNPITGTEVTSVVADNESSVRKYGIWEQVVSGGTLIEDRDPITNLTPAEFLRNTYLEDHKEPEISHSPILVTEGGSEVTITIECKGYIEWLTYIYNNNIEAPFTTDVTTKITTVLAEDPNSIISTIISSIDYNGILIGMPEDSSRTAIEIISEAVELGGSNSNRWIFGIYENRIPHFHAFSSAIDYYYYISKSNQVILNLSEVEVEPWNIRPGKIIFIPDTYLGGFQPTTDFHTDPRIMYLEEITFTAPKTINLQGKRVHKFEQLQKQLGLTGGA